MPLAAGISARWKSGEFHTGSPRAKAPLRNSARPAGVSGPMNCCITALMAGSVDGGSVTSGDTLASCSGGSPIQASAPTGAATSSATNVPNDRPFGSTRRTSSPASQPNVTAW